MRLLFDMALDGETWPDPLGDAEATAGTLHVGPLGFFDVLETSLGLGGRVHPNSCRAAALIPALGSVPGFWDESAKKDLLGVARELLRWRDTLWLHGWRSEPLTDRLAQLAEATREVLSGIPDRLLAVLGPAYQWTPANLSGVAYLAGTTRTSTSRWISWMTFTRKPGMARPSSRVTA